MPASFSRWPVAPVQPEDIDPYTLFIGNLPNVVTVQTVKQMFPAAKRIDIGHAQRIKHTRYAFIRFTNKRAGKPPTTVIKTKRRDDQLNDLFSCLEPDDDLSL
ncbi:AGAP004982-PA-like protein [Anopheles sinensis]|uniref:AGAP004982-PA-like protein n=1 Tax=Anopheles sinensis TaxID=74873 RepID=A0A084WDY5_ANOSI|nr:AGAP004982-PA-like protein [Anopheles sinensis]